MSDAAAASSVSPSSGRAASVPSMVKTTIAILGVLVAVYVLPFDSVRARASELSNSNSCLPKHKQWLLAGNSYSGISDVETPSDGGEMRFDCAELSKVFHPNATKTELSSYKLNQLRRKAYIYDRQCYERYYTQFKTAFLLRRKETRGMHYNLHIPKTGGTSLCRTVQQNGMKVPNAACHNKPGCAVWCCCGFDRPRMTCETLASKYARYQFVGNENYLDHPLCLDDRLYSVTIREPVSRAISHFEHILDFMVHNSINAIRSKYKADAKQIPAEWFGNRGDRSSQARRINLVQANYMTWSLIAGLHNDPFDYFPGTEIDDLEAAMNVLGSFDFIIGIGVQNLSAACSSNILTLMGMRNATLRHERLDLHRERGEGEHNYQHYYRRDKYALLNDYDVLLYKYSVEMMKADCNFFDSIITETVERGHVSLESLYFDFSTSMAQRLVVNTHSGSANGALLRSKLKGGM